MTLEPAARTCRPCRRKTLLAAKLAVMLACYCGCTYQVWAFMALYFKFPCNTEICTTYLNQITFPAFTLCNNNQIRLSRAKQIFPNLAGEALESAAKAEIWTKPMAHVLAQAHQHQDLIQACSSYTHRDCGRFAKAVCQKNLTIFSASAVNCISLNAQLNTNFKDIPQIEGLNHLFLALDFEPEEYLNNQTIQGGNFKIHHPQELANCEAVGYTVKPGTINLVALKMTRYELLKYPYEGNCRDYEDGDRKKPSGTYPELTKLMCEMNCFLEGMKSACPCITVGMVSIKELACRKCLWPKHDPKHGECWENVTKRNLEDQCDTNCSPPCRYEHFEFDVFENPFFSERFTRGFENYTKNTRFHENKQAILVMGYQSNFLIEFKQKAKIEPLEVFGYLGGYLGIWLGISFIGILRNLEQLRRVKGLVPRASFESKVVVRRSSRTLS